MRSLDDPRVAHYRDLSRRNHVAASGRFIAETPWVVQRMLAVGFEAESLLASSRVVDRVQRDFAVECPVYVAEESLLRQTVGFRFHRGLMACGLRRPPAKVDDLIGALTPDALLLGCIGVVDQANIGGLLRTAAAFGVAGVLLDRRCADPFSRQAIRVSMGAAFSLATTFTVEAAADIQRLREAGCEVAATVLDPIAEPLHACRPQLPSILLVGEEGAGLPPELIAAADRRVTIPMHGDVDSLNVVAATAVALHHWRTAE